MAGEYISALLETLFMVSFSALFSTILGFLLALILILTSQKSLKPNKTLYLILDMIINMLRSLPFIILMIVVIPLTRFIVGKSIGTVAAIVPLTISATPFAARIFEASLKKVDSELIETAQAFGLTTSQILFNVILKEALQFIVLDITLLIINLIGYSAMAGTIGGRGLGDLAIRYGYQGFNPKVMISTVLMLISLVQIVQLIGNMIYKRIS